MPCVAPKARLQGWQLASHAIGDAANRVALDTYERLLKEEGLVPADHRYRVEHAQVLAPEDLPRFAQLGVLPSRGKARACRLRTRSRRVFHGFAIRV